MPSYYNIIDYIFILFLKVLVRGRVEILKTVLLPVMAREVLF